MSLVDEVVALSQEQRELIARTAMAVRAVALIGMPNPTFAAGGMMGDAVQWLTELGVTREQLHVMLDLLLDNADDVAVALRRASFKTVE